MPWPVFYFPKVTKFILKLPQPLRMKVVSNIDLIAANGPNLREPISKKINEKIYELRIQGENSIRIFYAFQKEKYYLLHIFRKKSQKLPRQEIETALDRLKIII